MSYFLKNVFVSGYDSGKTYDPYDLSYVNSGIYPMYFVSIQGGHNGTIDNVNFLSNEYWKRLDDDSYKFSDIWTPTYQTSANLDLRPKISTFGDGYQQRSELSLFGNKLVYDVTFNNIDNKELKSLVAFFERRAGKFPFRTDVVPFFYDRKFIAKNWRHTYNSDNLNDLTVTWIEHNSDT